jgi:hypothetical protein
MNAELLPCPFCGGEAEIDRSTEQFDYCIGGPYTTRAYGYVVYCTQCSAGSHASNVPPSSREEAAKDWNKRAPVAAPDLLEALCFARSVILCGEPWTETCEQVIGGAIVKLKSKVTP